MGVILKFFLVSVLVPFVLGQEPGSCFSAGSVAGAAIGAFLAALLLLVAAYYLRKLYWKSRKGNHLVFSTDPESVKDEFAFDNPGFRQEERQAWQQAPTLPISGKPHALQAEFTKPELSKDDSYLQRGRVRHVKLWARDFTGLGLRCGGGARGGVHVHSVLRSGPAAAAKLQPGDKIKSIKIEFTGTPLEDAVAIMSLASPYPVELEVVEGGRASGEGRELIHPLLKRAGSTGDVNTVGLEDAVAIMSLASPYPVELEVVEGGRASGEGRELIHPLLKRAGSTGDVNTVGLEDAVAIMSLASPYPVELEVVEGGRASGEGRELIHPLLKRAGSTGDVNTVGLEDAVAIMSLASPYPVELEVVEGGRASGEGRELIHPLLKRAGSTGDVNTVGLEDAVAIMSLASPYPVELEVVEGGRASGEGRELIHPLLKRAGSTGDVNTLEKEAKLLHPPLSPNTSHSNNSTLETKPGKGGIKKIISEKIITSTTLERNKKDGQPTTLERENEKNIKLANKTRHSDIPANLNKPERNKTRYSTGTDVITPPEHGHIEHSEVQKKENDPRRAMKFGIRVLPPNIPDDGVLSKQKSVENGNLNVDKKPLDEPDRPIKPEAPRIAPQPKIQHAPLPQIAPTTQIRHENEAEQKKPVVAKRREKMAPPIPNARVKPTEPDMNASFDTSEVSENSFTTFARNDLNSSGIKRDENGIPQEIPQHMLDAARAARSNRKSTADIDKDKHDEKKEDGPKVNKKSKGKAPSPPVREKNKTDDSMIEQLENVNDFLKNEKQHSSLLHDHSFTSIDRSYMSYNTTNTSTPKPKPMKSISRIDDSINFSQDDIDDIVSKPFKKESDSLNNYFEDSKSNLSSNQDVYSVVSLNNSDRSDKGSTTIELNNSDITIHSSPLNETTNSASDSSILDEHERKATSLGDLSRFELRTKISKPSAGTLERAQSLDISGEDGETKESPLSPKKRKAMSVVESTFFDSGTEDILPDMVDSDKVISIKHKEPRLSLNINKTSAIESLNTFQRIRLKKGSEFGNLEDAIVKGSSSSIDTDKNESTEYLNITFRATEINLSKESEPHETSDHLARRIMDENMKVHLKLVSEFAKSTSDGSNLSSLDSTQERPPSSLNESSPAKYDEKLSLTYDTNIPDDLKVSRNTYVNSLERPKSDMMKKLLAKNPIFNVHAETSQATVIASKETPTPMTDSSKALHQPDIVNFDLKTSHEPKLRDYNDFVSNIRVGSNNNSLKFDKKPSQENYSTEWSNKSNEHGSNIVTISTNQKSPPSDKEKSKTYTKSIEIGEPVRRMIPDVLEDIRRRGKEREGRTIYMEPANVSLTMTQEPVQKTVTVNVAEDDFGNKVITQNVEKVSTKYIGTTTEVPLQVEQMSYGIIKNAGEINELELEEGNVQNIDKKILDEIRKQNPNMHFITDEPAYTKTETIILNTHLDEEQAKALMEKIQNDPTFMAQKTPEELSQMGIKIIHDLEDVENQSHDSVEVTKTKYTINPSAMSDAQKSSCQLTRPKDSELNKDHITEIQVVTPRTEKMQKEKSDLSKDKIASRQRAPPYEEPPLSYELDLELLNDFISNERHYSAKQLAEAKKRTKTNESPTEPKKRHSDFDLPRNTTIKFRTATYESPKGTIVTSTDLENRRLSQLDQMQLRAGAEKPVISVKPSSIPVKQAEKKPVVVSSKIPVFMSQKSLSQENLIEKSLTLPRSPPPSLSGSTGNISVTSIKSSSRSPSGGKM